MYSFIKNSVILIVVLCAYGSYSYGQTLAPELYYQFTTNRQNWVVDNGNNGTIAAYLPTHSSATTSINGCPVSNYPTSSDGTFIIADDQAGGSMWIESPNLGGLDKSSMLNTAAISFELLNYAYNGGTFPEVPLELVLVGGGTTSVYSGDLSITPMPQWQAFHILLSIDEFDANLPTVLSSLDRIEIRAEYINGLNDGNCTTTEYTGIDTVGLHYLPLGADKNLATEINDPIIIETQDFGYSHALNTPLDYITINSIPLAGTLFLDANADGMYTIGEEIVLNDQISVADLDAGKLIFIPGLDESGIRYANFDFTVNDGEYDSPNSYTIIIDVLQDTDGDGIFDRYELDADNDGILDLTEGCAGLRTIPSANGTLGTSIVNANDPDRAVDGINNNFAELSDDGAILEVELRGGDFVLAGTNINIVTTTNRDVNEMIVTESTDGTTFLNSQTYSIIRDVWTNFIFTLSTNATHIRIEFNNIEGGRMEIDNVSYDSFQLECLPRDTDGDTIPDHLDLDSDNDGISDVQESGFANTGYDLNNNGTISIAEAEAVLGAGNADADSDGLLDIFDANTSDDTAAASIGTTPAESTDDSDSDPDYLDLDSDGDAIPDAVEAQLTVGYATAFGGDADATDEDADGDGVRDMYDSSNGFGGTFNIPQNTDGTDTFDYLDLDSDNDGISDFDENGFEVATAPTYLDPNGSVDDPTLLTDDNPGTPEVNYRAHLCTNGASSNGIPTASDTDGDGVNDACDLDDDNDGILDVDEGATCSINNSLVTGSGFFEDWSSGTINVKSDGWDNYSINGIAPDRYPANGATPLAYQGNYYARFSSGEGQSQNITTVPGLQYYISFYYTGIEGGYGTGTEQTAEVQVHVDGVVISTTPASHSSAGWQLYTETFTAVSTSTQVGFRAPDILNANAGIDDFQVGPQTCVEANIDTDGDLVFNKYDLDSDNDGISDFQESGFANTAYDLNNDGTISIAEAEAVLGAGNADADSDGLLDIFDADITDTSTAASIGTTPAESTDDTDSIADFIDLDSDGDGIPDAVEAQLTVGYATNFAGDADATDEDADGDGVRDMYDSSIGFGGTFNLPQDTDGDLIFDYLDLDSDNDEAIDFVENGFEVTTAPTYLDPNGSVNDPTLLTDENTGTPEVNYRENSRILNFMRHGKHFLGGKKRHMYFGNSR